MYASVTQHGEFWTSFSFFGCMQTSFFCVAMINTLNGLKPVVALGNPLPAPNFLCKTNLIQQFAQPGLASMFSQWHLERWHQYSMWLDHHHWIIRLAQASAAGSVYHYSLDDPSRWCVKVRVAVTNAAVISPPSTLLANWPSKTLSTKHGRLGSAGARANTICLYPIQGSYSDTTSGEGNL